MKTDISKRSWILLWICLIIINVILRIPVTPHEIGHDSFIVHFLAESVSISGHAKWWLNPLSIVGLYPFSAASALPFLISGVSQSQSLTIEWTIWVVLFSLGIFSAFTAYLMAGAIKDDKLFKYITALVYSTSPGILFYTTWSASGRGLLLVLLPLFIYVLIKSRVSKIRFSLLVFVLLLLLLATHNLVYITIPIILSYLIVMATNKFNIKSSNLFIGFILIIFFIIFFTQFNIKEFSIISLIKGYARYIGALGFFMVGGFLYLVFNNNKTLEEKFLILVIFFLAPAMSVALYSKYFMLPFEALLASYGIMNLITISQKKNAALFVLFIFIAFSVGLSEHYQLGKIGNEDGGQANSPWAEDSLVNAAMWTRTYISKMVFADDATTSRRILAYTGVDILTETDTVYVIQDTIGDFNVSMRSPFSNLFYGEGPFQVTNRTGMKSWSWYKLVDEGLEGKWGPNIAQNIDINYYIRNERENTAFSMSFKERSKLYDSGITSIWDFRK